MQSKDERGAQREQFTDYLFLLNRAGKKLLVPTLLRGNAHQDALRPVHRKDKTRRGASQTCVPTQERGNEGAPLLALRAGSAAGGRDHFFS